MDKNKSRTDLLAAGRKKLQQFRQKKDGKGNSSHGKSSKKSGKSEQQESCTDAVLNTANSTALPEVLEGEIVSNIDSNLGVEDSSFSHSIENSVVSGVDIAAVDPLSIPMITDTSSIDDTNMDKQAVGVHENDIDSSNSSNVERIDVLAPSVIVETMDDTSVTFELESRSREKEELLPSKEDTPDARGDQVLDEADGLGLKQFGRSSVIGLEGNGKLALSEHGDNAETGERVASEQTGMADVAYWLNQNDGACGESAPASATDKMDEPLASTLSLSVADGTLGGVNEVANQQGEVIHVGPSNIEDAEMLSGAGYCGKNEEGIQADGIAEACKQQYMPEDSFIFVVKSHEEPLLTKLTNSFDGFPASPPGQASPINLSQLIDVIKGLSEDDYRLLLRSRGSIDILISLEHGFPCLMERLREELFLTSCTKDILQLQLTEQSYMQMEYDHLFQQLDDELSVLRASLNEAHERCESLAEELVECRSELIAVVSGREELQLQFHAAKAEVEEVSARANELQNSLEMSQSDVSNLLKESADSKGLVGALHAENKNLNQTIALLTEERKKLVEEKLVCLCENEKLLKELADCRNSVAALQVESSNLSGTLASVTEKNKKLEEDKECLANVNEKLSMDLSNCKGLVEALRVENANLRGDLVVVLKDRKKLEEDKEYSDREMERLTSELLVLHERISKDHGERRQLEVELKEVRMHLEQLSEENIFLQSSLELHRAKFREIDDKQALRTCQGGEFPNQEGGVEVQITSCEKEAVDERSHQMLGNQNGELSDGLSGGLLPVPFEPEVFDDSLGFVVLKGHLEEGERILQKLEEAIEGMHLQVGSLSGATGKVAAPAVSKLIQAFESKVHHDEQEAEERAMIDDPSAVGDPFLSTKEHIRDLKAVLKQLALDAVNARLLFETERDGRSAANLTIKELKFQSVSIKEHTDDLEATNIELVVLYEAVKQHVSDVKEKNQELEVLCETLKKQDSSLKAENSELGEKLSECESRINELHSQLHDLQRSSDELASVLRGQLETFQKEAADRALTAELEWNSTVSQIIEAVERLDDSTGFLITSFIATGSNVYMDISSHATASVNAAIKTIEDLKKKLEVAFSDHEATFNLFKEVNEKWNDLLAKNELACGTLRRLYCELRKLVADSCGFLGESDIDIQDEELPGPVDYNVYKTLMAQLENFLAERLHLQSVNNQISLDLMSKTKAAEELNRRCIDLSSIEKLIEHVEGLVKPEDSEVDLDGIPISRLESLVSFLVHKCKEADKQVSSCREEFGSKEEELTELQEKMHQLTALKVQHETEILLLKEKLNQVEEALSSMQSELQEKVRELEQSEHRVSSIREKLSIAVNKGKGLVVQRDSLKQSLSETSNELERCSQELQLKDTRLRELETKLKTYSEAGERVESLESELSYIRNSATALRESFLLKDSVLQRIEEILEDLDLPENFHSRDIIEKVDWLARSATGNSLPPADLDQKCSAAGSYSDAGFVVMDAWKEDIQPSSNSGDDLRRKYDDLQGKFFGLAEQNEMLEQSLMERNQLVQRWEELLDRINMPAHLQSMEPEDRIQWLGNALCEAYNDRNSLLQNIDKLQNYCGSLTADLEQSQERISCLNVELEETQRRLSTCQMDIQEVIRERDNLFERLEIQSFDHEKLSAKAVQLGLDNEKLQTEVTALQEKLLQKLGNEEHIQQMNGEICRLQDLVCDALKDPGAKDLISGGNSIECLEGLLRKLIENYAPLSLMKPVLKDAVEEQHAKEADTNLGEERIRDILDNLESDVALLKRDAEDSTEPNVGVLKKELEEKLSELVLVKEERDRYVEKQQSLICEIEALERQKMELQELLSQEEQKSTSVRDKLNVAVRKGKSLIQQRDSLKQSIKEMSTELEHLKSEIKHRENSLAEYELKMRDLTTFSDKVEALESESLFLRNRLAESERILQEKEHNLTMVLNTLGDIDLSGEIYNSDPIKKLEQVVNFCRDLHAAVASSEEESRKSRRAAELLLAELNEVQDRNDSLQEELAKVSIELAQLSNDREVAEVAKYEALSRLEKLSLDHIEEKKKQYSGLALLKSAADQLRKSFSDINNLLAGFFSKDLEFLQNLESGMKSCLNRAEADLVVRVPLFSAYDDITASNLGNKGNFMFVDFSSETNMLEHLDDDFISEVCISLQEFIKEIAAVNKMLHEHTAAFHKQASSLSKLMGSTCRDMSSQKESFEAMKQDVKLIESNGKEKDMQIVTLRRNIALLHEACTRSLTEIENRKAEVVANSLAARNLGINLKPATYGDGGLPFGGESYFSSEEHVKTTAEKLLLAVKDLASLKGEIIEGNEKEMKITISNLQKELQEKDIQRERICKDLVSQIKQAEAAATSYSRDLQSSKSQVHDLEKKVDMIEVERNSLEQRVKELQDQQTISTELQEKVRSLTDTLNAKDQEIEALMQALDEEEIQMDDLTKKVGELEKIVQQKKLDIENLEASRGKVVKKLSTTVSKFDELHLFSESLLAEVEKLQSQLQDRDAEISFLRQELTRCTNDALVASQISNKRNSDELYELLTWIATVFSLDVNLDDSSQVHEQREIIQKKITSVLSELESRDALLQIKRSKVDDLTRRVEILEKSLREKESQLNVLEVGDMGQPTSTSSEILEVEPVINKWTVPGPSTASQVRSLRKVNNDQVAIAIDMDPGGTSRLEDEDDEKVHGFKSLTSSRIVPKFTRPVTDMIDGLWVSCDRALMRQPALRLSIMIYWAVLHALLAAFVV
ncbi:trans-Golgi network-localized SYP41-interacting protein 1-like isoform X2 [Hevea brasiliensis]|uniref:trans-Golgi network-localized SYP41-interacting protein 1-like isoform X2 n=1 Tax=Hevea brasiliensis TaxID=3981 RepID=UPI0025F9DCB8|nr:trans-Golgi network-localized SYP41-interacting protein 1-like isoform X2 [Hevea brasiliensis]